jgi:hypothetical protein
MRTRPVIRASLAIRARRTSSRRARMLFRARDLPDKL